MRARAAVEPRARRPQHHGEFDSGKRGIIWAIFATSDLNKNLSDSANLRLAADDLGQIWAISVSSGRCRLCRPSLAEVHKPGAVLANSGRTPPNLAIQSHVRVTSAKLCRNSAVFE